MLGERYLQSSSLSSFPIWVFQLYVGKDGSCGFGEALAL